MHLCTLVFIYSYITFYIHISLYHLRIPVMSSSIHILSIFLSCVTIRKTLINDTFNASLKSYNDTSLKRHGLACHCISLHIMTLILSVIFVNQNYDIHLKRHSLLVMFQSNNLTMTLI